MIGNFFFRIATKSPDRSRKRHASDISDESAEKRQSRKDRKKSKRSKEKKTKKRRHETSDDSDGSSSEEAEWVEVTKETIGKTVAAEDDEDDNIVGPSLKQSEAYQREQALRVE